MIQSAVAQIKRRQYGQAAVPMVVAILTLVLAAMLGMRASITLFGLILALILVVILVIRPVLGPAALVLAALIVPVEIGTGTDVKLNAAFLLMPVLLGLWALGSLAPGRATRAIHSAALWPLFVFSLSGLLSLFVGSAFWDPSVPRSNNLILVQLTQWAIFAFSAGAFWLTTVLIRDLVWLRRLTLLFLILGGVLIVLRTLPGIGGLVDRYTTTALIWPPAITLLAALAGGQLLFNRNLARGTALLLAFLLGIILIYTFVARRQDTSVWIGVATSLAALIWLRFSKWRWLIVTGVIALAAMGVLFPAIYNFAGGEKEWIGSGGSRLVLIQRVIEVAMRNPITGLGPAAYRSYAAMRPLAYQGAYWVKPAVNSHNNYVDLFAHTGLLGLALFAWFAAALARTGLRLRQRYVNGFSAGYVNAMLAAGLGSLVLMMFADWILPHVYNIGFTGFQASVLVWLFMGGLVAIENWREGEGERGREGEREKGSRGAGEQG